MGFVTHGWHRQVEIKEQDKYKIAFSLGPLGFYECNRIAMGLSNSAATFQRLMERCMGLSIDDATPEEHNQFKDVADKDWENFLVRRARELKPGGFLIVAVPVLNDACTEAMYNVRQNSSIWKGAWDSLLNNGVITEEEYIKTTINFYLRNEDELLLPFNSNKSVVHGSGLELQTITIQPAVYLKYDERYEDVFTRTEFEQRLCDGLFSVIHGNIWYALSETRTETNRMAVMDTFREEILRRLRESKTDSYQFPRADIVMRKNKHSSQTIRTNVF